MEEEKDEDISGIGEDIEKKEKIDFTSKFRENPWMLSTIVAGALILIMLVVNFSGGLTGKVVSSDIIGEKAVNFINSELLQGTDEVTLDSVELEGDFYKVIVDLNDRKIPTYFTKDGKYYISSLTPVSSDSEDTEKEIQDIPKTDKPSVELYVFTYCPYGLQMEKAMMPVVELLNNKIDFKIRQIGAMHGEYEKIEAERQLCIEKEYPDKFLDYVLEFALDTNIGSCGGDATCLAPKLNALFTKLGIDANKINTCMSSESEDLYNAEVENSNTKGVSGSPTLIINGVKAQSSRSPDAVKELICSAFSTMPSECSQTLSTSSAAAGFGAGTSSGSSSASC